MRWKFLLRRLTLDLGSRGQRLNFDLPVRWSWARLEDVADSRLGKMLR